jgi:hypothetical protein
MGSPAVVRCDLYYELQELRASISFHFAYAGPVTAPNVLACHAYARAFDTGSISGWDGWSVFRSALSILRFVRARSLDPSLNFTYGDPGSDAVVIGTDGTDLVLDPVESFVVQWITPYSGKGRQGRSYLPYAGGGQIASGIVPEISPFAYSGVKGLVRAYVAGATGATGGRFCVLSRQAAGVTLDPPVPVEVAGARLNRGTWGHVRLRQQT